jgi:DUF4097 and DUF4098 domain-containing protein YvlB
MRDRLIQLLLIFCLQTYPSAAPLSGNGALAQETKGIASSSETSPYIEKQQRQFSFYPGGKLQISTGIPGNVKIIGWDKSSVVIEVEMILYYLPADQAKLVAAQNPLYLTYTQTSAVIRTPGPLGSAAKMETNLTIYVPQSKTDVNAKILQGDFAIEKVNGWIEATLMEGNIEASSMGGYFSATTRRGDLSADMTGSRWVGHDFSAVTQNGSIHLELPIDYASSLSLETRSGEIAVDYPDPVIDGQTVPLKVVTKKYKKKSVKSLAAPIGGGGAPLKMLTHQGNIELAAKR